MSLRFVHDLPLEQSMIFEEAYPVTLKTDLKHKYKLKNLGAEFIYLIDSEVGLIGETYFIEVEKLPEKLNGVSKWMNKNAVYVYSTTILPMFRQKGHSTLLKAYFIGYIKGKYKYAIGHARENASIILNLKFGAEIIKPYTNWFGTNETFYFYKITIS